jgi:hypothetical protein
MIENMAERVGLGPGRFPNRLVAKGMAKTLVNTAILDHSHPHHISQISRRLTPFSEFLELMHPSLLQWNLYAADAASAAPRAVQMKTVQLWKNVASCAYTACRGKNSKYPFSSNQAHLENLSGRLVMRARASAC